MSLPIEQGGWGQSQPRFQLDTGSNARNTTISSSVIAYKDMVENLMRKNQRIHRVSVLITSTFSLVAALIVILVVLSDAKALQSRRYPGQQRHSTTLWSCIHKAELMPLAIALTSVLQSCIFLGVQSQSLHLTWVAGCGRTAQLIWPAIWIVAFTVSAFSLELTFRSLQPVRFEPRSKRHLLSSVLLIGLLLSATLVTARVIRSDDICFGNLVWWSIHFVQPSIALGAGIILVNLITGVVLTLQLLKTVEMCRDERIVASRVIYSLAINILLLALLLPFFISYALSNINREVSSMADSVVTLNGLLHGVAHLFLRTNSEALAIRSRKAPWSERRRFRLFGPNDLNIHDFISTPIVRNRDADRNMLYTGLGKKLYCEDVYNLQPRQQFISIHPDVPPPPFSPTTDVSKAALRLSSYTIFPPAKRNISLTGHLLPDKLSVQVSDRKRVSKLGSDLPFAKPSWFQDGLTLPQPPFMAHSRKGSETRSEIVEIALRLSKAPSDADSVYIHEPAPTVASTIKSVGLSRKPSLVSPDKYVQAAKLAEAARARSISPGKISQHADVIEVHRPVIAPRIIGVLGSPTDNGRKLDQDEQEISSGQGLSQDSCVENGINKQLPPIPAQGQIAQATSLDTLEESPQHQMITPEQQLVRPVPDWRRSERPVLPAGNKPANLCNAAYIKCNSWERDERV